MCPCLYRAAHKAFLLPAHNLGDETPVELSVKDNALGNIKIFQSISYPHLGTPTMGVGHTVAVLGLRGKVLVAGGGYRGGFCEKLLEASPMSDKVNASGFQDGPTAGQG